MGASCCGIGGGGCEDGWETEVVGGLGRFGGLSPVLAADVRD